MTFIEYMQREVGGNWVIARRTSRIVARYGEDVVCLSQKRYAELEHAWRLATMAEHPAAAVLARRMGVQDAVDVLRFLYQNGFTVEKNHRVPK